MGKIAATAAIAFFSTIRFPVSTKRHLVPWVPRRCPALEARLALTEVGTNDTNPALVVTDLGGSFRVWFSPQRRR